MKKKQFSVPVDVIVTAESPADAYNVVKSKLESLGAVDTQNGATEPLKPEETLDGFRIWFDSIEEESSPQT